MIESLQQPIQVDVVLLITKINLVEKDVHKLKGSDHRVLFQNADGNINMGVLFNDPDVDLEDIYWYNILAMAICGTENEELFVFDEELNTSSCYVELHRKGLISTDLISINPYP